MSVYKWIDGYISKSEDNDHLLYDVSRGSYKGSKSQSTLLLILYD